MGCRFIKAQHVFNKEPSTVQLLAEGNDFLESSTWPIRSMDIVALLELEDFSKANHPESGTCGVDETPRSYTCYGRGLCIPIIRISGFQGGE